MEPLKTILLCSLLTTVNALSFGQEIIPDIQFYKAKNGKSGLADARNMPLTDTTYDKYIYASLNKKTGEGMFQINNNSFIINFKNEIVLDLTGYTGYACLFVRDKIPAEDKNTGKAGYLGRNNIIAIPFIFDGTNSFDADFPLAAAAIGNKWGVIDESGEWILQPNYGHIHSIESSNSFVVLIGKKYWRVNASGKKLEEVDVGC